jgi:hypothetical protein
MIELNDDIDDLGRDAAKNIHTKFDNKAWGKMETLLDKEDPAQDDPVIPGFSAIGKKEYKSCNGLSLFLIGFFAGAALLLAMKRLQKKS